MDFGLWRDTVLEFFAGVQKKFRSERPLYVKRRSSVGRPRSLALPLVLSGIFLGSVIFTLVRERSRVRSEEIFHILEGIDDNLKVAQDLLGLDDSKVREELSKARESLERARLLGLGERRVEALSQKINAVEEKLLKVRPVSSRLIYDLSSQGRGVKAVDLAVDAASDIFVLDGGQEQIFKIAFQEEHPQVERLSFKLPPAPLGLDFSEGRFLVWNNNQVVVLNEEGDSLGGAPLDASWGVVDIKGYSDKVYILSDSENQVLKSFPDVGRTSRVVPWLKENLEIDDRSRMGIDGDIYLWIGGTLRRFRRGREVDFSLQGSVGDPIVSPRTIVVWRGSTGIYILDSDNLRVLKFSKDGVLLGQYVDSRWSDLRALAISADERRGYVLSGNKIWEFELNQR